MKKFDEIFELRLQARKEVTKMTTDYLDLIFDNENNKIIDKKYPDFVLEDINSNLSLLKQILQIYKRFQLNREILCVTIDGQIVPVNIFQYRNQFYDDFFIHDYPRDLIDGFNYSINENFTFTFESKNDVKESLRNLIYSFIGIRYGAILDDNIKGKIIDSFKAKPSQIVSNNLNFLKIKAITNSHGLDLSASPAYFINWKKFGGPSSPVKGVLMPGAYLFGGSGVSLPIFKYDPIPVDIPPNFKVNINI